MDTIGLVGTGAMGSGIIEVASKAEVAVVAYDINAAAIEAGKARVEGSLDKAVARGKLDETGRDQAATKITWTTDLADMRGCQLAIEAAPEILDLKLDIFKQLDGILPEGAIMATNTSSIPIIDIAMGTNRPEQVCGMHFFNPATVMRLVEVISTQRTDAAVAQAAAGFASDVLGKRVVHCKDRAGFVVNALLVPFLCQAIAMFETGHASAEDIDEAMKLGAGHPMGPLALCDMIGLDVMLWTAESLYDEYNERFLAPPPLLRRMVSAGHLGRKTGKGFYDY
ncbi:MAG: 3-hydroxybutyryl-CoA dehydrogenase [Acidimicrobiaceae bacterium]|nr:3-hydroxybutyryl-CoA dehydrogenase [Acidimicrobiaceae bacterium]MXW75743.1 3-hydroxybutyryl-CoA dehydrogenase [Acidimicrobiaceae bacterium]MYA73258.1 3-hydroxybutyryl-CoA dehydrogenase [Acidimicrobiaceae bacterium]MYC43038.1 3-hydroxybutyryl-CoA dehydrogenase [Acidimicrobiaceae bacterium]MYD07343.1 3-hydroxybutyryl-CoA dehydrogenase [Acidimicrobiaceae bacterium]